MTELPRKPKPAARWAIIVVTVACVVTAWLSAAPQNGNEITIAGNRKEQLPSTGAIPEQWRPVDLAMRKYMQQRGIKAGSLAVMKDGKFVVKRGYGYLRPDSKMLVTAKTPFRIASVGKPITIAAILRLIAAGLLGMDTRVFDFLGVTRVTPPEGKRPDPRLKKITVAHLLHHEGGWDRNASFDPMFATRKIAKSLGLKRPPTPDEIIQYMAGRPLDFEPGSNSCYSNFGYCVLGRVIEKASKKSYIQYIREDLLKPLGITGIELGRSLPKDRNPKEPIYFYPYKGRNVMHLDRKEYVPLPDGGFHIEAMDSHGGLIASAVDLAKFFQVYEISGKKRTKGGQSPQTFFGSLPGTWSMVHQRADNIHIVALFNQRSSRTGLDDRAILGMLNRAVDRVISKDSSQN